MDNEIDKIKQTGRYQLFLKVLESKNYEQLYTMFGKTIYALFTPFEYKKQDIKRLLDNNDIAGIYNKYGKLEQFFIKNLRRRKKEDIKRLLSEKRYIELLDKYDERTFNEHKKEIYKEDVEYETGSKLKAKLYKSSYSIAKGVKTALASLSSLVVTSTMMIGGMMYNFANESYANALVDEAELIQEYDEKINNYAYEINSLGLDNDLDVVMKVMYDMWDEMKGYGIPEINKVGLGRLDFAHEGGKGVCRNIADDFSARMNAINPEYNARNLIVYFDTDYYSHEYLAKIDTTNLKEYSNEDTNNALTNVITNLAGNHMVSIFEPIGKNYTLVVDATNPSIGIIENGKIYMFQTLENKGLSFKPVGQLLTVPNYEYKDVHSEFTYKSFVNGLTDKDLEELNTEWGLEAQNASLEKISQNKRTY